MEQFLMGKLAADEKNRTPKDAAFFSCVSSRA